MTNKSRANFANFLIVTKHGDLTKSWVVDKTIADGIVLWFG
jgi:hypothetical protein